MRSVYFVYAVGAVILILLPLLAFAGEKEQRLYPLPIVGNVVDAEENEKYNLFGPIEGFIAAKFYEYEDMGKQRQCLHILGETEGGGYLFVRELDIRSRHKLRELEEYLRNFENKHPGAVPHSQADPCVPFSRDALEIVGRMLSIKLVDDTELLGTIVHVTADTIFLKDLSIPLPDFMIKEVKVAPSGGRFSMRYLTLPVSGLSESGESRLGWAKHLRLWFGSELEGTIHLQREPIFWTVLADSLVLTGPHDVELPAKPLTQMDVGRSHLWRGLGIGLLVGIVGAVVAFDTFEEDCGAEDNACRIALFALVSAGALLTGTTGAIVGSRVWWDTIYCPAP